MEYILSVLENDDRISELIELFATGLGKTTESYWRWRLFTENGQPDPPIAVVVDDENGKMCGMSSILPVEYGIGTEKRKCVQFCDWVVHPKHRGKGIIRMIYDHTYSYYLNKGYDFIMEFPNDNSYPIFQKYGFSEEAHIDCWRSSSNLFPREHSLHDITVNGIEIVFSEVCPIDSENFYRKDRIVRTPAFLRWKYDQAPNTEHKWIGFKSDGRYIGYVVYTLTHGRFRTAVNVYDWEYPLNNSDALNTALGAIGKKGHFTSIWGRYDVGDRRLLEQCGFKRKSSGTRFMLKAMSVRGMMENITLTRIDTDY